MLRFATALLVCAAAMSCARRPAGNVSRAQFIENHVYVPVRMVGQERLWIVDCGAGGRVIVEPGAEFGTDVVLDRSGMQLLRHAGGGLEVAVVCPGTPADRSGLRPGDVILLVGGRPPDELGGLAGVREMLRARPGTRYRLGAGRGDSVFSTAVTLEDLRW